MDRLLVDLEGIPDDEPWHVGLGEHEYLLSNFEVVDQSIYERSDLMLANVVKNITGPPAITENNLIEFEVGQVRFVKSVDGAKILYSKEGN